MELLIIGLIVIILLFIFRKIFKFLFYIGIVLILLLVVGSFSSFINGQGILDAVHKGFESVDNSEGVQNLKGSVEEKTSNVVDSTVNFSVDNIEGSLADFFSNDLGLNKAFNGISDYESKPLTLDQYRNSKYYNEEVFNKGDKYVYVDGILCFKDNNSDNYNIYEANINGYNYNPIVKGKNNFSGFDMDPSSITIDGINYYKGLSNNSIELYGKTYGTKGNVVKVLNNEKIIYETGAKEIYINDSVYRLGKGRNDINVDGNYYYLVSGEAFRSDDYLNMDGTLYWKTKEKNKSTVVINGMNYSCRDYGFLDGIL